VEILSKVELHLKLAENFGGWRRRNTTCVSLYHHLIGLSNLKLNVKIYFLN
jgi:hypothetical protein